MKGTTKKSEEKRKEGTGRQWKGKNERERKGGKVKGRYGRGEEDR